MNNHIQQLTVPITFPSGVRMGEGKTRGNLLTQARDGSGQFVLRGTALAGAIRHAMHAIDFDQTKAFSNWFGSSNDGSNELIASRIKFADSRLSAGKSSSNGIGIRNHIAIDRHRGAPIDGGLFSMECLPPGTSTTLVVIVECMNEDADAAKLLLQSITGLFEEGIVLGGSGARGIGRAVISAEAIWNQWDLTDLDQHAEWLDASFRLRCDGSSLPGTPLDGKVFDAQQLSIQLKLAVPRGQDFLIGDGQGIEFDIEPQQIVTAAGDNRWLLPGATLRGLFRAYVTRLAARDGHFVADSYQQWQERNANPQFIPNLTGDDIAYGFASESERDEYHKTPNSIPCHVMRLFGSAYAKGRIHIADAVSSGYSVRDAQVRISGGANDGFLFDNQTLVDGEFIVNITVKNPTEEDANWIIQTIRAVDMGLIRVGSSKGAGRLALLQSPNANGPFAEKIKQLQPLEVHCA